MKRVLVAAAILALEAAQSWARVPMCADGAGPGPHRTRPASRVKVHGMLIDVACDADQLKDDACTFVLRDPFCFPDFCTDRPVTAGVALNGRRHAAGTVAFRDGVAVRLRCARR